MLDSDANGLVCRRMSSEYFDLIIFRGKVKKGEIIKSPSFSFCSGKPAASWERQLLKNGIRFSRTPTLLHTLAR